MQPVMNFRLKDHANALTSMGVAVQFVRWADARHKPPTHKDVMARFNVSRATAYRWINGYYAGSGWTPGERSDDA
jgi:hypothetical protein